MYVHSDIIIILVRLKLLQDGFSFENKNKEKDCIMSIRYEMSILTSERIYILNIESISKENIMCGLVTDLWCGDRHIGYRLAGENVRRVSLKRIYSCGRFSLKVTGTR